MDDSYASRTNITDIPPSSNFTCNLGIDSAVRVSHARTHVTVKGTAHAFGEQTKTTTVKRTTTIHNTHRYAIQALQIRDILAISDTDSRIKVVLRHPAGLAEEHEVGKIIDLGEGRKVRWSPVGGEKEGRFMWSVDVKAGAKVKVESEWDVKCPSDVFWQESIIG